jgi:hypothetical protein
MSDWINEQTEQGLKLLERMKKRVKGFNSIEEDRTASEEVTQAELVWGMSVRDYSQKKK